MRWYSVSVFSNFEKKVAENIKEIVAQKNLQHEISEVLVPTEEVLEIRRGKKSSKGAQVYAWICVG
jgi:transcriptional antiterminator NusG